MHYFLAILLLVLTVPAYAQAPKKPVMTIAADEWCPINCNPQGPKLGVGIDLAKRVFEPAGYEIRYILMPWPEALAAAREGKIQAVVGAGHADDASLIFPDMPIAMMSDDFYVAKGNAWQYQGMHTLKNKRVGVIKGYGYGKEVKQFIAENKDKAGVLYEATGKEPLQENIDKLSAGKIDIVIESKAVMSYTLNKLHADDKVVWAGGLAQDYVYLAFSPAVPGAKGFASQYDATVRTLKSQGGLEAIYAPYGLRP